MATTDLRTSRQDSFDSESASSRVRASTALLALPITSGLFLALSFPHWDWTWMPWMALVPLALALLNSRIWPDLFIGLYLGGLLFQLAHLDWMRSGTGADWLSGPRATQWLAQGTGLALIWPAFFFWGRAFINGTRLPMAVSLPIVWIAFEFARRHLWAIVDATGYPFGQLGLTQADFPRLIQIADLGGVYAVSAVIASVNGLLVDLIVYLYRPRQQIPSRFPTVSAVFVLTLVVSTMVYGTWRLGHGAPRVGPVVRLMPGNDQGAWNETPDGTVAGEEFAIVGATQPDLLVWTEGAYLRPKSDSAPFNPIPYMERYAHANEATLVVGWDCPVSDNPNVDYNAAAVVHPERGYLDSYKKIWLVPFNEFCPPGRPLLGPARRDAYVHGMEYPVFDVVARADRRSYSFGIEICYDTCFPDPGWHFMRPTGFDAPQFFVVPACEAHDRAMRLQKLLLRLAQFRAIECRRAFVRNADAGYSGIIDSNGVLIAAPPKINFDKPEVLGPVPIDDRYSFYAHWRDGLPIAACAIVVGVPVWQFISRAVWPASGYRRRRAGRRFALLASRENCRE